MGRYRTRRVKEYGDTYNAPANGDKDPLHPSMRERPASKKKNTRRWCRGKPGVEHTPMIELDSGGQQRVRDGKDACYQWPYSSWDRWVCRHHEICTTCGKILKRSFGIKCPDKKEDA